MTLKSVHKRYKPTAESNEFRAAIEAFQQVTGMRVCVKVFDQGLRYDTAFSGVLRHYMLHTSAFCLEVKCTRNEQCKECDLRQLPARCERERKLFPSTCHAGANEIIIPLIQEETLIGVGYVGQFRTTKDQPASLPLLTSSDCERLTGLAQMLMAYLTEKLGKSHLLGKNPDAYRAEIVHSYLQAKLHTNPGLSELARHMGLSTTRVAHIIKELTGRSFIELKDEMRLKRARDLLCFTYHKIEYVAGRSGFSNSQYFHRFFKLKTGMTPRSYRMKNQTDV